MCVSKPNGVAKYGRRALNVLALLVLAIVGISASLQSSPADQGDGAISNEEKTMEVVVIDSLVVPELLREYFFKECTRARKS